MIDSLRIGPEVGAALAACEPVVALESTIFSALGLPEPFNRQCWERVEAAEIACALAESGRPGREAGE